MTLLFLDPILLSITYPDGVVREFTAQSYATALIMGVSFLDDEPGMFAIHREVNGKKITLHTHKQ